MRQFIASLLILALTHLPLLAGTTVVVVRGTGGEPPGGTEVTDTFNRPNADNLGSDWGLSGGSTVDIYSNRAYAADGWAFQYWSSDTFADDQYAEFTQVSWAMMGTACVGARMTTGTYTGYAGCAYLWNDGYDDYCDYTIRYCTYADCSTTIGTMYQTWPSSCTGNTMRLEVSGTSLTLKVNGTTRVTGTHSTLTSGYAGMIFLGAGSEQVDDWAGGDL